MSAITTDEMAEKIVEVLESKGRAAKVWDKGGLVRIYVKSALGYGAKDHGFIEILLSGERNYKGLTRQMAGTRDLVEDALSVEAGE